jgi:amicyanin
MDMNIKAIVILLSVGLLVAATAGQAQAKTYDVSIKNHGFNPAKLTISAGDTVTWTNNDPAPHDVDFESMGKSPVLKKGETYSKTFNQPGTYDYDCDIHPYMRGTVVVK